MTFSHPAPLAPDPLPAAIVLCGGRSTRMGVAKLSLPFGPETMLWRIVRQLQSVARPILVVAAPEQELPSLPSEIRVARDRREDRGPLEGLRAGLAALPADIQMAYATSCDVPLLVPGFVGRLVELLGDHDIAVPHTGGYYHPLSAVYHTRVLGQIDLLLAADRRRPLDLFEIVSTRAVTAEELTGVDPELQSLRNLNSPQDYLAALATAGFTAPPELLELFENKSNPTAAT